MNKPSVKELLGTTRSTSKRSSETLYRAFQSYIDSKEKKDKKKDEKKFMEYWPLIKGERVLLNLSNSNSVLQLIVVRIQTKADALSTGVVIVDLPVVHGSNTARAAATAGYKKQCSTHPGSTFSSC